MPPVSPPNVDVMLIEFFTPRLQVPVHSRVPSSRPASFVRAWRTGGGAVNRVIDQPLITVQAWAASDYEASELAGECRDLLLNEATGMPLVRQVEIVSGPYLDPDPDSQQPRYSVNARLTTRGRR